MPDNSAYEKLKRGLGLAPQLKPEPVPQEEPSFLSGYTDIVTQTFSEAAKKLGEGLHQLNPHPLSGRESNPVAGVINTATALGHLGFAPISSAFGVADKGLRDVGLDPVADVVNFAFELPAKTVKKGSDFIEENIYGVKDSAKLLGVKPETMQEIYDASVGAGELIGTLVGLKGYSAVGKAFKSKFRGKKPTPKEFQDYVVEEVKALPPAQQQKLLANPKIKGLLPQTTEGIALPEGKGIVKSVREKNIAEAKEKRGYSETTEPIKGKRKTADEASETKVNKVPLREEYDKTATKTETADINRSRTTDVTKDFETETVPKVEVVSEKKVETVKNEPVENAITKVPRSELPETISKGILEEAEMMKAELKGGSVERGKSYFNKHDGLSINGKYTINDLPDWFRDIKGDRKSILNALDKIIKDKGLDKGVMVERVKSKIMEHLVEGKEDAQLITVSGKQKREVLGKNDPHPEISEFFNEFIDKKVPMEDLAKKWDEFDSATKFEFGANKETKPSQSVVKTKAGDQPSLSAEMAKPTALQPKNVKKDVDTKGSPLFEQKKVDPNQLSLEKTKEPTKAQRDKVHTERNELQNESAKAWMDKKEGKLTQEEYDLKIKDINKRAKDLDQAFENIKEKSLGRTNMFGDPTIIKDYVVVAKHYVQKGYDTFKAFAKKMIEKFSDKIRPHLRKIWNETQKEIKRQSPEAKKITEAIKSSKVDRKKTDQLYAEARGQKYSKLMDALNTEGEKGYFEALKSQKGELPKADFEAIRNKFSQKEIDNLYKELQGSNLNGWEQLTAMHGLTKVLGEKAGKVPTLNELDLLKRVFGEDFTRALQGKKPTWDKIKANLTDIINIPRALVTSTDMSAMLRQGLILTISRPRQSIPAIKAMHKYFFSDKAFKALNRDLETRPNASLYEKSGLYIAKESVNLAKREEAFMSHLAERIPIFGHIVRASERAYIGYLNKVRADVFDAIAKDLRKEGITFGKDPKTYQDIANFVNLASGRGSLGKHGNRVAPILNGAFFSIRNLAAKVQLANPITYAKMTKRARVTAIKDMIATVGTVGTMISLATLIPGVTVEKDPRSADFMKVRYKNTRIDPWGGFQQFVRFIAQMVTGETKSSISGKVRKLDAKKFPFETRLDRGLSFIGSKVSPQLSIAGDILRGETMFGEDLELTNEAYKRLSPLYVQDIIEASNELGVAPSAVFTMFGFYGAGLQTYGKRKGKAKKTNSSWKF